MKNFCDLADISPEEIGKLLSGAMDLEQRSNLEEDFYVSSWSSTHFYGDNAQDQNIRRDYDDCCIHESWFDVSDSKSSFYMPALPARRGIKVEDHILDGPRSIVAPQARN